MTSINDVKLARLLDGITDKSIYIYYGKIPDECNIQQAVQLKRDGRYDESLTIYLDIILEKRYMLTELGRSMAKTLCAMNEYLAAYVILFDCASVKWEDKVNIKPSYPIGLSKEYEEHLASLFSSTMPTQCASDFYELRDCLKAVLDNDFAPILKRTEEWSGNPNYAQINSMLDIYQQAQQMKKLGIL